MTAPVIEDTGPLNALVDLANHVLATVVYTFEQAGVDLPQRQLVVIGEAAIDSEMLVVMFGGAHLGPPANELSVPYRGDTPRTCVFSVDLWRAIATTGGSGARSRSPKADRITAEAGMAMVDSWLLLEAGQACDSMNIGVIESVAPLPPSGGLQGNSLALQVQVP